VGGLTPRGGWQIKVSPNQQCWVHGVTRQERKSSAALCKGAGLCPPCLGAEAGAIEFNIPSMEGNSHKFWLMPDFYFVYEAKKIRLPVLQTAPGTFDLPELPSLKDILRQENR